MFVSLAVENGSLTCLFVFENVSVMLFCLRQVVKFIMHLLMLVLCMHDDDWE